MYIRILNIYNLIYNAIQNIQSRKPIPRHIADFYSFQVRILLYFKFLLNYVRKDTFAHKLPQTIRSLADFVSNGRLLWQMKEMLHCPILPDSVIPNCFYLYFLSFISNQICTFVSPSSSALCSPTRRAESFIHRDCCRDERVQKGKRKKGEKKKKKKSEEERTAQWTFFWEIKVRRRARELAGEWLALKLKLQDKNPARWGRDSSSIWLDVGRVI